ncbi:MAG: diacylglycerol kinase family lipid kinase [Tissierellia bacterium]|nr:diacylglycerol kinase family lipid kinase [Tissierellia bacterium]
MTQAMLVVNPSSGKEEGKNLVGQLVTVLMDQYDSLSIRTTHQEGDASHFAREAAREKYEALYLMGGDGTINEGLQGIAQEDHRPTLGLVPLGTVNNAASMLGFSNNYREAIQQFSQVKRVKMDIGRLNDRYFISSVVTGVLASSLKDVSSKEKTQLGFWAYLKEALDALGNDRAHPFKLEIDGVAREESLSLIVVSLGPSLLRIQDLFPEATIDDGYLNLAGLKEAKLGDKLGVVSSIFSQGGVVNTDKLDYTRCKSCKIFPLDPQVANVSIVDGDQGPGFPLEIEVLPSHIEVFAVDK